MIRICREKARALSLSVVLFLRRVEPGRGKRCHAPRGRHTNLAQSDSGPFAPIYIRLTVLRAGCPQFLSICRRVIYPSEKALEQPYAGEYRYLDHPRKDLQYYRSNPED